MLNIVQRYGNKVLLFAIPVLALGLGFDSRAEEKAAEQMYFDFVQNASSGSFDGHTLTLNHVGPTIFFTDRPARISGHTRTSNFVKLWGQGQDSFKTDPPNAVLSMFKENDAVNSAVVELFDPKLDAATLTYQVKVLSGAIPSRFTEASLFVDRWGRGAAFIGGAMIGGAIGRATAQPTTTTVVTQPATTYSVTPAASPAPAPAKKTVEQQIDELNKLAAGGYITPEEYKAKKQAIIDSI